MAFVKNWRDMTNEELRNYIKKTIENSRSEEEVISKLENEILYPYFVSVSYSSDYSMFMFMAWSKDGNSIS